MRPARETYELVLAAAIRARLEKQGLAMTDVDFAIALKPAFEAISKAYGEGLYRINLVVRVSPDDGISMERAEVIRENRVILSPLT